MRTFAVGDIHGDIDALDRLLGRLPGLEPSDTLVFLGDYVDRGPASAEVVARIRGLQADPPCKVVALRGNHEDTWARSFDNPNPTFLLHRGNGCAATWRSFTGRPMNDDPTQLSDDEFIELLDVRHWFPEDIARWMAALPTWYEDEHAIYVHAGLDGDGAAAWVHPSLGREKALMWMRETDFYNGYQGKRVIFGHTRTRDLPLDQNGLVQRLADDPADVWNRGDLFGIDTGAGMGGFLSALELPRVRVHESR
ncbi:MAG: metallophosphoesterase family protein [Myxococcota bacterium]